MVLLDFLNIYFLFQNYYQIQFGFEVHYLNYKNNVYDEFIAFWTEFRSKASDLYDKMPGITAKMIKMSGKIGYRVASHRLKKKLEAAK